MAATLSEGDDPVQATRELQSRAEQLVEDHKQSLLKSIEELYHLTQRQAEMIGLQNQLESAQRRIDEIRASNPKLQIESTNEN